MPLEASLVLVGLAALVVGGFVGWAFAFGSAHRRVEETQTLRQRERSETERAIARLRRELEEALGRTKDQTEVFLMLPDLVRQMFSARGRRGVGSLTLKLLDQLFRPEQAATFVVSRPRDDGPLDDDLLSRRGKRLLLVAAHGLPASVGQGFEVDFGQGHVGYVAEHPLAMDRADFEGLPRTAKRALEATPHGLRPDLVVPIEHEGTLLGVFLVGGPGQRQEQAKRLLKMVADLTAVALVYLTRLRTVEESAELDGLTGLLNKRALANRLGDEIHQAQRSSQPLSLLMLDIDHFKNYNDSNGHLEGDEVLKEVGRLFKRAIREDDLAARYGGEEFVILYPGAPKEVAERLAENLRRTVEAHSFPHGTSQPLGKVTISGGVATFPEDALSAVDLLRAADQSLYEAKGAGRNRIIRAVPAFLT
ncbi:MAG TPA: diguanylate cyclase [Vicinamibacteria bacterium]|nr:diguanylate cyclase [Vicinamibacteria bacterium]